MPGARRIGPRGASLRGPALGALLTLGCTLPTGGLAPTSRDPLPLDGAADAGSPSRGDAALSPAADAGAGPPTADAGADDGGLPEIVGPEAPDACAMAAEACNAADDDCDGAVDEDACPCAWRAGAEGTYLFCDDERTWTEARARCQGLGYDLVVLETRRENTFVVDEALRLSMDRWWIGAQGDRRTDTVRWVDGTVAVADGVVLGYDGWQDGQPNRDDECASLEDPAGLWDDHRCTERHRYVCEAAPGDAG